MSQGRVLIVDDDERHRLSLRRLVESAGHRVVGDGSGPDVPALLDAASRVDLMLLDLVMPGVDGFQVLTELRGRDTAPAVIVLTAEERPEQLRRLMRLGASDYLAKPYSANELLASIDAILDRRANADRASALLERVRASDRLHRFLVERSPDVIYMLDGEGRFTFLSASATEVFGRPPDAFIGRSWRELFAPGEQERAKWRFNERRTGDRATRNLELRLSDDDGTAPRWIRVSATGIFRSAGDDPDSTEYFDGTYGIARDVTDLRAQEQTRTTLESQLEQSRRMEAIGQLAGGIAHDFNNILASMIGYAELAQMIVDDTPDSPAVGYLDEVVTAGQRARDLIAQLLNFSRPTEGAARPVRLGAEVDGVTRMLRALIPSTIRIQRDIDDDDLAIRIDPTQLQQVVLNLVINARDALDGQGEITVAVRRERHDAPRACIACTETFDGERIVLEVADDGPGIAEEILRRLFDPLVTARPGTRGTGFGLTVVQRIVHAHGGHIEVDSTPGGGTRFRLHFPSDAEAPADAPSPPAESGRPGSAQGHVVVVDDEASVANFLRQLLEHVGYETTVFGDPETALDYLRTAAAGVDLVITDQTMPQLTGIELSKRIAELDGAPPVILCTGYGHELADGTVDTLAAVIAKPFEIRDMLGVVARLLGRAD